MDKSGKFLFPPQQVTCYPFENGYAIVTGLTIDGVRYYTAVIDTEGRAVYKRKGDGLIEHAGDNRFALYHTPPAQFIYIDKKGKQAIPRKFDWASAFVKGHAIVQDGGQNCLIDKSGRIIARFPYKYMDMHNSGLLLFRDGEKTGLAEVSGKVVVEPKFYSIDELIDGVMGVCEKASSFTCGYINIKGEYLFTPRYPNEPPRFSEGLAFFKDKSDKCGYIDKKGDVVIDPVFHECENFRKGLAWVAIKEAPYGIRGGYIDTKGKFVWKQKTWLKGYWEAAPTYSYYNQALNWGSVNYSQLQQAVFHETNRVRALHGLPPFRYSYALERAARGHSEDMANLGFYSHDSKVPGKETVKQRLALAGVRGYWAENISRWQEGRTYGEYARKLVWAWTTSPGHRLNIIRKELTYLGVGIYKKGNEYRATQNFSNVSGP